MMFCNRFKIVILRLAFVCVCYYLATYIYIRDIEQCPMRTYRISYFDRIFHFYHPTSHGCSSSLWYITKDDSAPDTVFYITKAYIPLEYAELFFRENLEMIPSLCFVLFMFVSVYQLSSCCWG